MVCTAFLNTHTLLKKKKRKIEREQEGRKENGTPFGF